MDNFTPGPHVLDSIFPDEDGYKIVKEGRKPRLLAAVKNQGSVPCNEAQANARLYAAAPDLYAALDLVLPFFAEEQQVLERSYLPEPDEQESAGLERIALLIKVVSAALAKADGKAGA